MAYKVIIMKTETHLVPETEAKSKMEAENLALTQDRFLVDKDTRIKTIEVEESNRDATEPE